ncbi:hypothetical protein [Actinoplanes derwentensis]|uniref:Uncharacterized protein n=1 Tax=Actinoplanes derwentensis TaxID=113562 RepID=A0A1H2D7R1_9ACTN|nr:hypothetical protein [Actinoplanes derwentensis]GID86324.1 hypothetical protein Ade03nite_52480 [Actinoplanes derwentensis]SDT78597.1 hypothetical protein SAMN04489716_8439 [Actinoplanes derwentensis]
MTAPGDTILVIILAAALMACCGYATGRLHQRRQSGADRATAYKRGYDAATRSVFSMAARAAGRRATAPEVVELGPDVPGQREARHAVPEELVRAATYLLPPDRVARARVPHPRT